MRSSGWTGHCANFVSAESGRVVTVTNEGNGRFCVAANRIHIAMVGIEKIVPLSRTPRKLTHVIKTIAVTAMITR